MLSKSVIDGILGGVSKSRKEKQREWEYENLNHIPYLHSSSYLNEMYHGSRNKYEDFCVLEHIYKYSDQTFELDSYMQLEKKIVSKWRGKK